MLAAWRRYWFSPASLTDLGVSRAVLAGLVLVLNGTTRFVQVGMARMFSTHPSTEERVARLEAMARGGSTS